MWEAFGRRLRRNYLWIYLILGASWFGKNYLFPQPATSMSEFMVRASVGPIPGYVMIVMGIVYHVFLLSIAVGTVGMTQATGEVLPRFGTEGVHGKHAQPGKAKGIRAWLYPSHRRDQYLALIITDKAALVADCILTDLGRGVTSLEGKGMYTGQAKSVLMCAITVTEVHNLKAAVAKEDPRAFVVISPTVEVLGRGFGPLELDSADTS